MGIKYKTTFGTDKTIFLVCPTIYSLWHQQFLSDLYMNGPKRTLDHPWNAALRQVKAAYGSFYNGTVFSSQCGIHMH